VGAKGTEPAVGFVVDNPVYDLAWFWWGDWIWLILFWWFSHAGFPRLQRKGRMNSWFERRRFRPKWSSSICPLKFWCLAIKPLSLKIFFFFFFFLISPMDLCNWNLEFLRYLENSLWFQKNILYKVLFISWCNSSIIFKLKIINIYIYIYYFITSISKAFLTKHIKLLFVQPQFQPQF